MDCPNCGSKAATYLGTTSTMLTIARYKDRHGVEHTYDPNTYTKHWQCRRCGNYYEEAYRN